MSNIRGLYYPFSIIQGETFKFSFDFYVDGLEQYFDEYTFVGQVRDSETSLIVAANMTFVESEEAANIIDVSIPATQAFVNQSHVYEIRATNIETSEVKTLFYGTFEVKKSLITTAFKFGG